MQSSSPNRPISRIGRLVGALATRLLPWRRVARDMQRVEATLMGRFDSTERVLADELARQRGLIDAQVVRQDHSLSELAARQDRSFDDIAKRIAVVANIVRPKRLFISTGCFATAMAATITTQQRRQYDDYLLVVLDRQSTEDNRRWAWQAHDEWVQVACIGHVDYYERSAESSPLPFSDLAFDEVYSPFTEMSDFVASNFRAARHHFYEEGLTSYLQALRFPNTNPESHFFTLAPSAVRESSMVSSPIDYATFVRVLERTAQCYRIPLFEHPRTVILVATGLPPNFDGPLEACIEPYNELAETLCAKGYTVWVKEHPRVPLSDVYADSRLARLGVRLLETDAPLLESVLIRNRTSISAIVSVYSSVLVHSHALFGIPAFSMRAPTPDMKQEWWKGLQDRIVPDADVLAEAEPAQLARIAVEFHNRNLGWSPPT